MTISRPLMDEPRLRSVVRQLCAAEFGGRLVGTAGEAATQAFLHEQLSDAGFAMGRGHATPFDVLVPELTGAPRLVVGGDELEHLWDYGVNVQGAAGSGQGSGAAIWFGTSSLDERAQGRVVVRDVRASAGAGGLEEYLDSHRAAREIGASAVLQVSDEPRRRKVMCHRGEEPTIASLDVSDSCLNLLFGVGDRPRVGQVGAEVVVEVPLVRRSVSSVGNVVAEAGSGPVRAVLVAHYDHVGRAPDGRWFQGAADNASGVAVVLEAARALVQTWSAGRLVVLLTSAEEEGMVGAQRFVETQRDTLSDDPLVLNVDELGGSSRTPLFCLATSAFRSACLTPPPRAECSVVPRPMGPTGFADHVPFLPHVSRLATLVSPAPQGTVHTLRDTVERLDMEKLAAAAKWVAGLVEGVAPPGFRGRT